MLKRAYSFISEWNMAGYSILKGAFANALLHWATVKLILEGTVFNKSYDLKRF
jgi:hypothetical protein